MEHQVDIWSILKEPKDGKYNTILEGTITVTEEMIQEAAVREFHEGRCSKDEDRRYYAEIDQTII